MNIKKAISFIAFGFLFTLVNINLTINNTPINITPDFIGWILLYLAYDKMGDYMKDKSYMKTISLVMIVLTGVTWLGSIVKPELDLSIIKTVANVISAVYMFILCTVLEKVAHDLGSVREGSIRTLKYINIAVEAMLVAVNFLARGENPDMGLIAGIVLVFGLVGIVAAIVTMFVLFGLNKEINAA